MSCLVERHGCASAINKKLGTLLFFQQSRVNIFNSFSLCTSATSGFLILARYGDFLNHGRTPIFRAGYVEWQDIAKTAPSADPKGANQNWLQKMAAYGKAIGKSEATDKAEKGPFRLAPTAWLTFWSAWKRWNSRT
jgi:hypothetical protein